MRHERKHEHKGNEKTTIKPIFLITKRELHSYIIYYSSKKKTEEGITYTKLLCYTFASSYAKLRKKVIIA